MEFTFACKLNIFSFENTNNCIVSSVWFSAIHPNHNSASNTWQNKTYLTNILKWKEACQILICLSPLFRNFNESHIPPIDSLTRKQCSNSLCQLSVKFKPSTRATKHDKCTHPIDPPRLLLKRNGLRYWKRPLYPQFPARHLFLKRAHTKKITHDLWQRAGFWYVPRSSPRGTRVPHHPLKY